MRYQQPWGISDPDAPYINGNPAQGQQGSIPPAACFEQPQREIVGLIEKSFQTPSDTNLLQLTNGVRSQRLNYALDTGTPHNLTVAYDPPFNVVTNPYTPGLTLHVRVRFTNVGAGQVSIDAGAGRVPVRKMNNSDVGDSELPIGCIICLIFDGTAFQLANFGGAGGDTNVTQVNVPYTVDQSPVAGEILADFGPSIPLPLVAGNIIAVQVRNTTPGATVMFINTDNTGPRYELAPNGGGMVLQGDIVADDVVQFFYDGNALRFTPNPEMNAAVTYTVGPGQQFATVDEAMNTLKRKIIGANGYVTLLISTTGPGTPIIGPIDVAHPSGDRLCIRGTMINANPVIGEMQANGSSAAQRAQDAIFNINYLRGRYGTEIALQNNNGATLDRGIVDHGAGRVRFADLLITGNQLPLGEGGAYWQVGVDVPPGLAAICENVSVWGCQSGFSVQGAMSAWECIASANTNAGFGVSGWLSSTNGAALGTTSVGYYSIFGTVQTNNDQALANGDHGFASTSTSGIQAWFGASLGNGIFDHWASGSSSIVIVLPAAYDPNKCSPPPDGTIGNFGSVITTALTYKPPA